MSKVSINLLASAREASSNLPFSPRLLEQDLFQNFESIQLPDRCAIKNRSTKIRMPYMLNLDHVDLYGYKTLVKGNTFFNDEVLYPSFDPSKMQFSRPSPIDEQITFDKNTLSLVIDTTNYLKEIQLDEVVGVFSSEPSNFGSFMYRVVPKLQQCINAGLGDKTYLLHCPKWMVNAINVLFNRKLRIVPHYHQVKYKIGKLHLPSQSVYGCYLPFERISLFQAAARRTKGQGFGKKIYISRRSMSKSKPNFRILQNEDELVEKLSKLGFKEFCPELHSIEEQICTFRDAEAIVVNGGSALFNIPYALNAKYIIDLESSRDWIYAHSNLLYSVGVKFAVIYGSQKEDGFKQHRNWSINIEEVIDTAQSLDKATIASRSN